METHWPSPLALDGWHEFNRIRWGVRPERLVFGQSQGDGAQLEAVLYLNRRGRVYLPHHNPYLPVCFRPSPTSFPSRNERRWLTLAEQLASFARQRMGHSSCPLSFRTSEASAISSKTTEPGTRRRSSSVASCSLRCRTCSVQCGWKGKGLGWNRICDSLSR